MLTSDQAAQIKTYGARIERVDAELAVLNADKSEIYKEAKEDGLNPKLLRRALGDRRREAGLTREETDVLDAYRHALETGKTPDGGGDLFDGEPSRVRAREEVCGFQADGGPADGGELQLEAGATAAQDSQLQTNPATESIAAGADRDAVDPGVDPDTGEILDDAPGEPGSGPEPASPDPGPDPSPEPGGASEPLDNPDPEPQPEPPADPAPAPPEAPEAGNGAGGETSTGMDAVIEGPDAAPAEPPSADNVAGGVAASMDEMETTPPRTKRGPVLAGPANGGQGEPGNAVYDPPLDPPDIGEPRPTFLNRGEP